MIWPACNIYKAGTIPSWAKFGARGTHTGLDICHKYGNPVVAAEAGTVRWTGNMKAGGYAVWITHPNDLETRYLHLQPTSILVKKGDVVTQGQQIAKVGHSGLEYVAAYAVSAAKLKSASHLHFEVRKNGTPMDPETYLSGGGIALAVFLAGAAIIFTTLWS
jgi:murein DD-endopeptidase MepM/ murein hydrolase activator NlpD